MNDRIDVFTPEEVKQAKKIIAHSQNGVVHQQLYDEVVTDDVMKRIDSETGQENVRSYMAYRLEYIAGQA